MSGPLSAAVLNALEQTARATPGLELLMLFGSRARADPHPRSDWDFGYLADARLDPATLMARLVEFTGSDRVDLVDLGRAGGLLRYRAARDGQVVYERRPDLGDAFRLEASTFWCEAAPVLLRGYDEVLAELER